MSERSWDLETYKHPNALMATAHARETRRALAKVDPDTYVYWRSIRRHPQCWSFGECVGDTRRDFAEALEAFIGQLFA